jgi:hypothetical protein
VRGVERLPRARLLLRLSPAPLGFFLFLFLLPSRAFLLDAVDRAEPTLELLVQVTVVVLILRARRVPVFLLRRFTPTRLVVVVAVPAIFLLALW